MRGRLGAYPDARLLSLRGGLGMVPLTETLLQEVQRRRPEAAGSSRLGFAFEFLGAGVEAWAEELSGGSKVAYVETEYYAGEGYERSVVWENGKLVIGPLEGAGAMNRALRALGVTASPGQEEFHLVGLGRHRTLAEWLSEA